MEEEIRKCCDNMAANADLYRRIAKTKELQEDDFQKALAEAQAKIWSEASVMVGRLVEKGGFGDDLKVYG